MDDPEYATVTAAALLINRSRRTVFRLLEAHPTEIRVLVENGQTHPNMADLRTALAKHPRGGNRRQ